MITGGLDSASGGSSVFVFKRKLEMVVDVGPRDFNRIFEITDVFQLQVDLHLRSPILHPGCHDQAASDSIHNG